MDTTGVTQFVRTLYFDMQTVEGVKPLEIWNGVWEKNDPLEMAALAKNLLKIAVPLVNEKCTGLPFTMHARRARETVTALMAWFRQETGTEFMRQFPDPPTQDDGQKALYRAVREQAATMLEGICTQPAERRSRKRIESELELLPDGLFDFREMRIVENELPFIIFTDKEYRVIHGLAIVYMWIIDADGILLHVLERHNAEPALIEEYRQFSRRIRAENPFALRGKETDSSVLVARIREELKDKDYFDIFENVHRWLEQTKAKYVG